MDEHRRRTPDCQFFRLLEYYGSAAPKKGKSKAKGRTSTASKISRQSSVSIARSEAPSVADSADEMAGVDDSVMTTGSTMSQTVAKGKKTSGRAKAAGKTGKVKKSAKSVEPDEELEVQYPDMSQQMLPELADDEIRVSMQSQDLEEPAPVKPKKGAKKGGRQSKLADSSIVDASQMETQPKKRGRKPKVKVEPDPEPEFQPYALQHHQPETPELQTDYQPREDEVEAQIQEELDQSMDLPDAESTPQMKTKPKRGAKRTSDLSLIHI